MRLRIDTLAGVLLTWSVACLLASASGCAERTCPRLNAPPQGDAEEQPAMSEYYAYHDDQGMLADMSIADIHFVPHSPQLSGVGEARLQRYAELLAATGGCLHYDTALRDESLIEARLATARSFVRDTLPSAKTIEIAVGLPGGRGMTAKEAKGGVNVAKQAEPRANAYHLNDFMQGGGGGGSTGGGGGGGGGGGSSGTSGGSSSGGGQ
ncbi:MAG TPA: hypothetical protein VMV94_04000 [Phycisphaerae bacterium]|nr:hypothetical protein [Phycisphaerae bacterium]